MDRRIGEWQLISNLGEGTFGVVSLWRNLNNYKSIAVKSCKRKSLEPKQSERWLKEVQMVRETNHPNIVSYQPLPAELAAAIDNPSGLPLLPMEYCNRGNLRTMLQQLQNSSGLQEEQVRTVLGDTAGALSYLHRRDIVHRDFKPENVVVQEDAGRKGGLVFKLIDLGLAKEDNDTKQSIVGTPNYVAPEILQGKPYNHTVDYWSFGIVAYEVICGDMKYPFLSNRTPIERIQYIRDKEPNVISICETPKGIEHLSRINRKCHISTCLKEMIENWLKSALEFDGAKRRARHREIGLFDELKGVLNKKIVTVFSVFTLEFYSYEINDCTLVSTLKEWISRDTKVQRQDQILLTGKTSCESENELVVDVLSVDEAEVSVFKRGALWNEGARLPSPSFLTEKMEKVDRSKLVSSVFYYLLTEFRHFSAIVRSFLWLHRYLKYSTCKLRLQYENLHFLYCRMIGLLESYNSLRKGFIRGKYDCDTEKYKGVLTDYVKIISDIKLVIVQLDQLKERHLKILSHEPATNDRIQEVNSNLLRHAQTLEQTAATTANTIKKHKNSDLKKFAIEIISGAIKERRNAVNCVRNHAKYFNFVSEELLQLRKWMSTLKVNLEAAISSLNRVETLRYELLTKSVRKQIIDDMHAKNVRTTSDRLDADLLIKTNKAIRLQLEDVINTNLNQFRVQCQAIDVFLRDIRIQ